MSSPSPSSPSHSQGASGDPATQSAEMKDGDGTAAQSCPLRGGWVTLKPLRYAVADDDEDLSFADGLELGVELPSLSEHQYITREIDEQFVYLYNQDDEYLLEVTYEKCEAKSARCVWGNAPAQVKSAFPLLKQPGDAKIVMWLTHEPLTQKVANDLASAEPEDIATFGQVFDLKAASEGSQPDMAPNDEIDSILSSLMASTSHLNWTSATLEPQSSSAPLLVDYEKETPQNSYLVCLNDPIGITTDLCREFSLAYGMAMEVFKHANHPYMMANLTETYIDFEVDNKKEETSRKVAEWQQHPEKGHSAGTTYDQWNADRAVAAYKEALEGAVHHERMTQYKLDHKEASKKLHKQLDDLGVDWLAWLNSGHIDWALCWYDLDDKTQIEAKEAMLMPLTNNMGALDDGCKLRNQWIEALGQSYQGKPAEPYQGVSGHVFIALGYAEKVLEAGTKWLNIFKSIADPRLSAKAQADAYFELLRNMPATVVTDALLMEFAHAVTHYSVKQNTPQLYNDLHKTTGYRSGYTFKKITTNLGEVQTGIKATAAYEQHIATKESIPPFAGISNNTPLELFDLDQPISPQSSEGSTLAAASTKPGRFFVRQLAKSRPREGGLVGGAQKFTNKILSPAIQNNTTAMFFLVQAYNVVTLNESDSWEKVAGSYVSLVSSSFASIDLLIKKFGKEIATDFSLSKEGGANWLGAKLSNGLISFFESLKQFEVISGYNPDVIGKVGRWASNGFSFTLKSLPVVAATLGVITSINDVFEDIANNESWGVLGLSILGVVVNSVILGAEIAILVMATVTGVMALPYIVIGTLLSITIGVLHSMFVTPKTVQFLARSFWGKGEYKYAEKYVEQEARQEAQKFAQKSAQKAAEQSGEKYSDQYVESYGQTYAAKYGEKYSEKKSFGMDKRLTVFEDKSEQNKELMQNAIDNELKAFLDHLCKPKVGIASQSVNEQGLSTFTVAVQLIGYDASSSAELQLQGYNKADRKVLVAAYDDELTTRHASVQILPTQQQAIFSLQVNESQLIKQDDTKYVNFDDYQLAITYHNPMSIPVSLQYPNIEIDDDSWWWSKNTSVDQDFSLANSE
ncbi:hypothetical protein [Vibrio palustris]|uniref:Uncharacterized protein n=1 Tax=Vibrio palustris TaxID=1918946 RepID=A0A1R4B2F2_9VIBR|nr:hypothetical protein [Vibrio palustris]SJL83076.1 hypothetical protein VPAL9027_01024 [Vibrio palustris]